MRVKINSKCIKLLAQRPLAMSWTHHWYSKFTTVGYRALYSYKYITVSAEQSLPSACGSILQ